MGICSNSEVRQTRKMLRHTLGLKPFLFVSVRGPSLKTRGT
jgi:hypothetical protein